MTKSDLRKT